MHALWNEAASVRAAAAVIETAAGLVIVGYCTAGFYSALVQRSPEQARRLVAEGALTALGFIVCATLLKTLVLTSWQQIGIFACVLSLRTVMKRIFASEANSRSRGGNCARAVPASPR